MIYRQTFKVAYKIASYYNLKKDSSGISFKEDLLNDITFDPCLNLLDFPFKLEISISMTVSHTNFLAACPLLVEI